MQSEKAEFSWDIREIRDRVRRTVFTKGKKAYFVLVLMVFLFSFIGITGYSASGTINRVDMSFGWGTVNKEDILAILDYVRNTRLLQAIPEFIRDKVIISIIWTILSTSSWLVNLFSMNSAYMQRNIGEVFAFIMLFIVLYKGFLSFIKKTLSVGVDRAIMENRFRKDVQIRRSLAPFGNRKLLHVIGVMSKYILVLVLFFMFSIIGWVWEVCLFLVQEHAFYNRGVMYGPWLPIYGAGGVIIIALLNRFKGDKPKLFVYTMLLCGILEYFTSFALEFFNNMSYWDYHNMKIHLNGRVCLAGLIAFDIGGFLGIFIVGPLVKNFMTKLGKKKATIVCAILIVLFAIDLFYCIAVRPNSGEGVGKEYSDTGTVAVTEYSDTGEGILTKSSGKSNYYEPDYPVYS